MESRGRSRVVEIKNAPKGRSASLSTTEQVIRSHSLSRRAKEINDRVPSSMDRPMKSILVREHSVDEATEILKDEPGTLEKYMYAADMLSSNTPQEYETKSLKEDIDILLPESREIPNIPVIKVANTNDKGTTEQSQLHDGEIEHVNYTPFDSRVEEDESEEFIKGVKKDREILESLQKGVNLVLRQKEKLQEELQNIKADNENKLIKEVGLRQRVAEIGAQIAEQAREIAIRDKQKEEKEQLIEALKKKIQSQEDCLEQLRVYNDESMAARMLESVTMANEQLVKTNRMHEKKVEGF